MISPHEFENSKCATAKVETSLPCSLRLTHKPVTSHTISFGSCVRFTSDVTHDVIMARIKLMNASSKNKDRIVRYVKVKRTKLS